jgi:hypothetical protein
MAYNCARDECDDNQCDSCGRIPYFSDADATYLGAPLGDRKNTCSRQIHIAAPVVAHIFEEKDKVCGPDEPFCQIQGLLRSVAGWFPAIIARIQFAVYNWITNWV